MPLINSHRHYFVKIRNSTGHSSRTNLPQGFLRLYKPDIRLKQFVRKCLINRFLSKFKRK